MKTLNWKLFKDELTAQAGKFLQFEYAPGVLVNASYHITEIKQAAITSVDCGGEKNSWTEVVVQLWEPEGEVKEQPMKVEKALSIIAVVEKVMDLDGNATVKIEFGNAQFDTRQMLPVAFEVDADTVTVRLHADTVQCKANERGGSCGVPDSEEACCAPADAKPKIQLNTIAAGCTPGGGCC